MPDWIPQTEAAFDDLADQFTTAIAAAPATYGLLVADGTALSAAHYDYTVAENVEKTARATWAATVETKEAKRAVLTGLMRSDGARIQATPSVSDAQRETAGLPVRKTSRTPAPAPTTAPVLTVDGSRRLEQVIAWRDAATPTSKARPAGVAGLELFIKVGTAPAGIDDCRPLGMMTRSPNLEEFDPADGGKTAYYIGRWVNTTGEHGPTSEIASGTIAAQT